MLHAVARWTLFVAMALSVPLLYVMIVFIGVVSYAHIIVLSVMWRGLLQFNAIYLVGYGALLYVFSGWLANRIVGLQKRVPLVLAGTVLLILAFGLLPIYGLGGHGTLDSINAYKLLVSGTLR
jgi:hypothetical protein